MDAKKPRLWLFLQRFSFSEINFALAAAIIKVIICCMFYTGLCVTQVFLVSTRETSQGLNRIGKKELMLPYCRYKVRIVE